MTNNPQTIKQELRIYNYDDQTVTIDSPFVKRDSLDLKLAPNSSVLPYRNLEENAMVVPIHWTPRVSGVI